MSVLVAIIVGLAITAGGVLAGVWQIAGALSRQADKVGVGQLRGGLLINRIRIPLLLWSALLLVGGLVLAVAWIDRTPVVVALVASAAIAAVAMFVLPKRAPQLLMSFLRGLRRRAGNRLRRPR